MPAGDEANGPRLSGKIERVEELGPEVLVYFSVNAPGPKGGSVAAVVAGEQLESAPLTAGSGTVFCATFEPRSPVRIGDTVEVAVDASRLHFFDPETDAAVQAPQGRRSRSDASVSSSSSVRYSSKSARTVPTCPHDAPESRSRPSSVSCA